MLWKETTKSYEVLEKPMDSEEQILPIDDSGKERVWRWGIDRLKEEMHELYVKKQGDKYQMYYKYRPNQSGVLPNSIWSEKKYSAAEHGTAVLKGIFGGREQFSFPKSIYAVEDCIRILSNISNSTILDYFAGSGTTAHAVINLNREDEGRRKYILVEMGQYFDTVTKPRVQKVIYSEDWKDGKPVSRKGSSHAFKYIRLESYEDVLNNLEVRQNEQQTLFLQENSDVLEDYRLKYQLNVETQGSLLNVEDFRKPFDYELDIIHDNETRPTRIDLVETFNYLIGLRVATVDRVKGLLIIKGTDARGDRIWVLWRDQDEVSNAQLNDILAKRDELPRGGEVDRIYVNGDNNLANLRSGEDDFKVRLIEAEFLSRMFDVQDA